MTQDLKQKTHWLQNPNKNYLGHQDLPNGENVVLTIKTAQWESVKNPRTNQSDDKRVIRFKENYKWLKPFIVNETNAALILKSTDERFMEDCIDKRIKLTIAEINVIGETVSCLRVVNIPQDQLEDKKITTKQIEAIQALLDKSGSVTIEKLCAAYKVDSLAEISELKYNRVVDRLNQTINTEK
jgi:hypothetical protein